MPVVTRHPREVFPPKVWLDIFRWVKDPQDLYNLIQASHFFAELLNAQLPHIQAQLVLPLLAKQVKKVWPVYLGDPPQMLLPNSEVLKLRLVCRSWDQAVQDYYQHHLHQEPVFIDAGNLTRNHFTFEYRPGFGSLNARKSLASAGPSSSFFGEVDQWPINYYRQWLNSVLASHPPGTDANPIPSRYWIGDLRTSPDRNQERTDFLQAYGRHMFRSKIRTWTFVGFQRHYATMRDWLLLTPNLVGLYVLGGPFPQGSHFTLEDLAELQDLIQSRPLPELPHLREMDLRCLAHPLQNALLRKYGLIETLHLQPNPWQPSQFQSFPLENLRKLQLAILTESDFLIFEYCLHPSWLQLHTLEVDLSYDHHHPEVIYENRLSAYSPSWERIISWLNQHFSGAPLLVNLQLCLPRYSPAEVGSMLRDTNQCRLRLVHVQQLKLRLLNDPCSMDFLLPMRGSLRKMAVGYNLINLPFPYDQKFPPNEEVPYLWETIQWNGWLGPKLLQSRIWRLFPQLDFLRVESRRGWTYRRRRGTPVYVGQDGREESLKEMRAKQGLSWCPIC